LITQEDARDVLGEQAADNDARQQEGRVAADDVGHLGKVAAEGGDLADGEVQPFGQDLEE